MTLPFNKGDGKEVMKQFMIPETNYIFLKKALYEALEENIEILTDRVLMTINPVMTCTNNEAYMALLNEVRANLPDVLLMMLFDRTIDHLGNEGIVSVTSKITKHRLIIGISCRYRHIESLIGPDLTKVIGDYPFIYDLFSILTGFLEFIDREEKYKAHIGHGLLDMVVKLSGYGGYINFRNVHSSIMINGSGVLLMIKEDNNNASTLRYAY